MKRFCLLLAVLLSFAGMQTVEAQKRFDPVKGELYVIRDFSYRLIVDNPDHRCTLDAGHPDLLNLNYDEGSYHELFYIDGDSASGYTIRPASRPDCYVYAVCDNAGNPVMNSYAGVGVKEVSGEPGDECIWYITCPPNLMNRRMAPKLNPKAFVSTTAFLDNHVLRHPDLRDRETYLFFIPLAEVITSGVYDSSYRDVVAAEVEKLKQQGVNATTWAAFQKATDEALAQALPQGWCRIRSLAPVDEEEEGATSLPYLYSNTEPTESGVLYTVLGNRRMTPEDGRYIWQFSPYYSGNRWCATLKGSGGKGINWVDNTSADTKEIHLLPMSGTDSYCTYFEVRYADYSYCIMQLQYGQSEEDCGMVTDRDWALTLYRGTDVYNCDTAKFVIEPVEESALPGVPYRVGVSAPQSLLDRVQVEYVGSEDFTGHHRVGNGGCFFLKSVPTADDFRATEVEGFRCGIVVSDRCVTVTYDTNDADTQYYCIGRRAETLESGKQYAVFNTASSMDRVRDRMALLYATKTSDNLLCGDLVPHQGAIVPAEYAWTLTQGSDPDLWTFQSVAKEKSLAWSTSTDNPFVFRTRGMNMRVTEWTAANPEWREINVKSLNDDGTFTTNSRISEANHVWTIGRTNNTMFWNGENSTQFATWPKAHPFAFYELTEITFPDGINGVKGADPRPATGTFDLQGRHVRQPHKGIYIQDGRKMVVK